MSDAPVVWVTGSSGMLGQDVVAAVREAGCGIVATDREVDITNSNAVAGVWQQHSGISWIVNCAAWTAVDAAEEHEDQARALNVLGPAVLARSAKDHGAAIIHISTDYVFSGPRTIPFAPDDPPAPAGVYGKTKREGEQAVSEACDRSIILRTAWLYGIGGSNFVHTMLRLMRERTTIRVVADQYGLPTWTVDLAHAIVRILSNTNAQKPWGVYHFTNAQQPGVEAPGISWHQFAMAIFAAGQDANLLSRDCAIEPITTREYPTSAPRPAFSVLDSSKTRKIFGAEQPDWRSSLTRFIRSISDP